MRQQKLFAAEKLLGSAFPLGRAKHMKRVTMSTSTLMPGLTPERIGKHS